MSDKTVATLAEHKITFAKREKPDADYCKYLETEWATQNGLKRSGSFQRWAALVKKPFKKPSEWERGRLLAGDDHCTLWNKDGKATYWVPQPYGLSFGQIKEMMERAEKYGLEFEIGTFPAWHYPGHVLFIKWSAKRD